VCKERSARPHFPQPDLWGASNCGIRADDDSRRAADLDATKAPRKVVKTIQLRCYSISIFDE